jgi:hypothetical protein
LGARIRLIHWHADEARARAGRLRRAGYVVDAAPIDSGALRVLRDTPPHAFVIDLSRIPSHGREIGLALRRFKATRAVPLVFVDGEEDKVARTRAPLPDATYTTWPRIRGALRRALTAPARTLVVPSDAMASYARVPLARKLGVAAGMTVALVDAPPGFEKTLGALPAGVTLRRGARGKRDLTLWFVMRRGAFERRLEAMAPHAAGGRLWIAWPKRAAGVTSDLDQVIVRRAGLALGLVDFKVCAIDATWSGLRFSVRR